MTDAKTKPSNVWIDFDEGTQTFVVTDGMWRLAEFTQDALDALRLQPARLGIKAGLPLPLLTTTFQ